MQISDPKAIRALAHPLRLDLLEILTATGPATAAHCGRILGVSQANCSFHLRQLAKYGFVEDAGPGRDQRERRWRVPDGRPQVRVPAGGDAVVRRELERVVVEREMQAILAHDGPGHRIANAIAVMSPEEAADVWEKWKALLEPYVARKPGAGQGYVRYFMAATPMTKFDLGEGQDG